MTGCQLLDAGTLRPLVAAYTSQPGEDDEFGEFCGVDSPLQTVPVSCEEQHRASRTAGAATALPTSLRSCRSADETFSALGNPGARPEKYSSHPVSRIVHQDSCIMSEAASRRNGAQHTVQKSTGLPADPQHLQQLPQVSGSVAHSTTVACSDGVGPPRDESWGEFACAQDPRSPTHLSPWARCSSPSGDRQILQARCTGAAAAASTVGPTAADGAAVGDIRSGDGRGLPLPSDIFCRPDAIANEPISATPHFSASPHAHQSLNTDSGMPGIGPSVPSTEGCSGAGCPTSPSRRENPRCSGGADVLDDNEWGEFEGTHPSGAAAAAAPVPAIFASVCTATVDNSAERQRSAPLPADLFTSEADGLPASITHSCDEVAPATCELARAGVPCVIFSARTRTQKAGAVCEGYQGETAYEQHHLYSHASEEEIAWGDGAYSEALLHQDMGSAAPRRSHDNMSVPSFQSIPENAAVQEPSDSCCGSAQGSAQKGTRYASMLRQQHSACGEATDRSGDGSNESVDELGFTTPAVPEDLAYDEAQAINSLFRERSSGAGNQLLAYSKATASMAAAQPDPETAITPRASSSEAAAQGGADGLLQLASCSPVSPSCVAQLSVHDSHVHLLVHGGVDDTAMLITGKESCAPDKGCSAGMQSVAVEGIDDVGQAALVVGEAEARRSMAELAPSLEATCVAGSMECDAPQDAALLGRQRSQADSSAEVDEKRSLDTAGMEPQCMKSGSEECAEDMQNVPKLVCATHSSAGQGAGSGDGGQPDTTTCPSDEAKSPTHVFARALSLSLRRISQSVTGAVDASGQPTDPRAVHAHVCERLARKGQHVLALAEAFARVGLAERLPAATIVGTAPPSFWPSIAVVHKLSRHILDHSIAQAAGDSENGTCSAKTAPVVPQLRATVPVEPMTARGGARVQSARPSNPAGKHNAHRKDRIVVDFPRELPKEQHTFRFRHGFDILDSAAEEETEEVVMYTSSIASLRKTAADTRRMRQILDAFQVQYQEVDLALQPRMRRRMLEISDDFNALPQLHCRGRLVGDGDTCFDLHDFGELMPILLNGESPRVVGEEPSDTESPVSLEVAAGDRHIFNHAPESCGLLCSNGPIEFEKLELPGELLHTLQVGVDSSALQVCLAELPPEAEEAPGSGAGSELAESPLCALTGLPCGDWKVDRVDASFAGANASTSGGGCRSPEGESGRAVIAAAANLWLSLVDEDLPSLGRIL